MSNIKYYDSFIPIVENEIATPKDTSFFFAKAYIENNRLLFMEGYQMNSSTNYTLSKVLYNAKMNSKSERDKLIEKHILNYKNIPTIIRYTKKCDEIFHLYDYTYNKTGEFEGYKHLSGQKPWFWSEKELFDKEGMCIEYVEYIMNEEYNDVIERHFDCKGGKLLYEEEVEK